MVSEYVTGYHRGTLRTPFQPEGGSRQRTAGNVDLLHSHLAGAKGVDERYFGNLTLFYGDGLGILVLALIQAVLREQFFYGVLSGQQIPGQNNAVLVGTEWGASRTFPSASVILNCQPSTLPPPSTVLVIFSLPY